MKSSRIHSKRRIRLFFLILTIVFLPATLLAQSDDPLLDESFTEEDAQKNGTQRNTQTDPFLDPSFSGEGTEASEPQTQNESPNGEAQTDSASSTQSNTTSTNYSARIGMDITNRFIYAMPSDGTRLNPNTLVYIPQLSDQLVFHNYFNYQYKGSHSKAWFYLNLDYRLFLDAREKDSDTREDLWDLDSSNGLEVQEANIAFAFLKYFEAKMGKALLHTGSSYLINPSNPLQNKVGSDFAWNRRTRIPNYYTKESFPEYTYKRGSKENIGSWLFALTMDNPYFLLRFAYLPKLETGFDEFDSVAQGFYTQLTYTQWYTVVPTLIFFYDDSPFVGADISLGLGDTITLQSEFSLNFVNRQRHLEKDSKNAGLSALLNKEIYDYKIESKDEAVPYVDATLGINYTVQHESRSLFNIIFEVYYNGMGLYEEEWQDYLTDLGAVATNRLNLLSHPASAGLAPAYEGILAYNLQLYEALRVRPLYLFLRLARDDVFSDFSTLHLNLNTALIYSPFDTSFLWNTEMEWVAKKLLSVGTAIYYAFGKEEGAFTLLPSRFGLDLYTKIAY